MRVSLTLTILIGVIVFTPFASDAQSSDWLEDENCNGRILSNSEAEQFFDRSIIIPGIIWIRDQVATPCQFRGETTFHGALWNYSIYPTGMGILWSEDLETQLFFKCESCGIFDDIRDFDEYE